MILKSNTIIDVIAMMIKSFYTLATNLAMHCRIRPDAPAEEAEVFQVSIFFYCPIKNFREFIEWDRFYMARVYY